MGRFIFLVVIKYVSILIVFILFAVNNLYAQFGYVYGNEGYNYGQSICYTPFDSGYFLLGNSGWFSNGNSDFLLYKVDSTGKIKWAKNYGGVQIDKAIDIIPFNDTLYALTGFSNNNVNGDYNLKLTIINSFGDVVNNIEFGSNGWDIPFKVIQDTGNTLLWVGQTFKNNLTNGDGFLLKTNQNADTLRCIQWGDSTEDCFLNISKNQHKLFIAGYSSSSTNGNRQALILKTDIQLNITDTFLLNTSSDAQFNSVKQLLNGNILAVGSIKYNSVINGLICLFDSSLNLIYIDSSSKVADEYWKDFIQRSNHNIIMMAATKLSGFGAYGFYDILFHQKDENLNFINGFTYGGIKEDVPSQFIAINDTIYALIASTQNFGTALSHFLFIKFNVNNPLISPETFLIGYNQETATGNTLQLLPNPIITGATLTGNYTKAQLTIYNITSSVLWQSEVYKNQWIDLSFLKQGIYFVEVKIGTLTQIQKLIKW
jgi:hypothetical protein